MSNLINITRRFAIALLLFNAINAIVAGWLLIADPSGSMLGMSTALLKHSPFQSFLIPGIALFVGIGLFSLVVGLLVFLRWTFYGKLIFYQGVILTGWIIIQMIMLQTTNLLHGLFGAIGILLVVFGIVIQEFLERVRFSR